MRKYVLVENKEPDMALGQFEWRLDDNNNAIITWEWPVDRMVRLMLVFELEDESKAPKITRMMLDEHPHEVITRDLGAKFTVNISGEKRRFLLCPAYFDENSSIAVYRPEYVTDWIFKKTKITTEAIYKALPLSQFQKVTLRVVSSDATQTPLVSRVLKYVIHERGRETGRYPLDATVMAGAAHFYIKKDQAVKFVLEDGYDHLLDIRSR
ncbi:MAG: hypothetical protein FWB91_04315 [Defluviitaleaceae bacterium]|nr:hypothetical protein [Defluviitaleaceae bacterium]